MKFATASVLIALFAVCILHTGCSDDDDQGAPAGAGGGGGRPDNTGSACASPAECYPGIDRTLLAGEVQCLDRVEDGYCTHLCETDDDCCSAAGECKTGFEQVCSPFESAGTRMCFLGCEKADLDRWDGGTADENEYCHRQVSDDFICRSSGGGSDNRKVCVPGDCGVGDVCGVDGDCDDGLTCLPGFRGGYCGRRDCATNADCPANSACVAHGGANYCFKRCTGDGDCSVCRPWEIRSTCAEGVNFVEAGTIGSVCVPPAP